MIRLLAGRVLCRAGFHRFGGWPTHNGYAVGYPLPYARCSRCGVIL